MSLIPTSPPPAPHLNKPALNKTIDAPNTPPSWKFKSLIEYKIIFGPNKGKTVNNGFDMKHHWKWKRLTIREKLVMDFV